MHYLFLSLILDLPKEKKPKIFTFTVAVRDGTKAILIKLGEIIKHAGITVEVGGKNK